jgi:hypothetical protein
VAEIEAISRKAIRDLGLPEETEALLLEIYETIDRSYRERFIDLTSAVREQSAALGRIQETLLILVEAIRPELARSAPAAFAIAPDGQKPDVATVRVEVLDPIAANYTLSQRDVALALGLEPPDVSVLARAFGLPDDPECAMVVRRGKTATVVNYHPRVVKRFLDLVKAPPAELRADAATALKRVKKRLKD